MPKENEADTSKKVDVESLNDDEKGMHSKATRSREDIAKIGIDHYGYTEGDPFLDKFVDREMAHGKSMSKLIGQKVHHRNKYERDIKKVKKTETEETETKLTDDKLQEMRKTASQSFVDYLGDKFPKLNVTDVYNKVKESYKETGKETSDADFLDTLKGVFKDEYSNEFEDGIRKDERKKVRKEDSVPDFSNLKAPGKTEVNNEKSFFSKPKPVTDWYGKKK